MTSTARGGTKTCWRGYVPRRYVMSVQICMDVFVFGPRKADVGFIFLPEHMAHVLVCISGVRWLAPRSCRRVSARRRDRDAEPRHASCVSGPVPLVHIRVGVRCEHRRQLLGVRVPGDFASCIWCRRGCRVCTGALGRGSLQLLCLLLLMLQHRLLPLALLSLNRLTRARVQIRKPAAAPCGPCRCT